MRAIAAVRLEQNGTALARRLGRRSARVRTTGWWWRLGKDRGGVLLVEYALIAAVTGMVAVTAIVNLGAAANAPLQRVQAALQTALHGGHGGGGACPPKNGTPH